MVEVPTPVLLLELLLYSCTLLYHACVLLRACFWYRFFAAGATLGCLDSVIYFSLL